MSQLRVSHSDQKAAPSPESLRALAGRRCDNPYPLYRHLRLKAPVWPAPWGDWYVASYAGVEYGLRSHDFQRLAPSGNRTEHLTRRNDPVSPLSRALSDWLIFTDPPAHNELRARLHGPFSHAAVKGLETEIGSVAAMLIEGTPEDEAGDFVASFSRPLPVLVIARILGIPQSDLPLVARWADLLRTYLDSGDEGLAGDNSADVGEMSDYFARHFDRITSGRISVPGLDAAALGDGFGRDAVAANLALLTFSGHDTTVHLIGNMMALLADRPALWARLRDSPGLAPRVVLETLRFESPVQKICRWTARPVTIEGGDLPSGVPVVLLLGSANRDETVFANADTYDVERPADGHLAFGRGNHVCLGRHLALIEARIALECLLARWRRVEPAEGACWLANSSFRGYESLPLTVTRV